MPSLSIYFSSARVVSCLLLSLSILVLYPAPAEAILGFGKKKKSIVPSEAEMVGQHSEANQMYAEAQQLQNSGSNKKARSLYKSIAKQYPLTKAAAHSQFQLGTLLEKGKKPKKAFEEYQEFISAYKDSDLFKEALKRQYHIASYYLENQKSGFLGFGANIQPSKLIEFFTQISLNAPYSPEAPKSLFNVGKVNARTGKVDEALLAYASVVERYPGTPIAAKAQYEIVQLLGTTGDKSYNPANSRQHREAAEDFLNQYGGDALASDVQAELGKLEDKDLEKAFNIGRFYERQGKYRSAVVYYQEVAAHPGGAHYEAAQARLSNLAEHDPSIVRKTGTPRRVETPPNLSKRKDYHGPPPPKLDSSSPRMRTSPADVTPIASPPASPAPKTEN